MRLLPLLYLLGPCLASFGADKPEAAPAQPLPAFPGAEGFGAVATGGRGGTIVHVTTLADSGLGSFRDAVSQPNRTVVFDVGGVIHLKDNVSLESDLTIAGQTAPGEGICLYGATVSLSGRRNVVIRYLRFRGGMESDRGKKPLGMSRADNIIIDHCSIEWGRWDNLGITVGSHDITVQYCLIAEAIHPQSFGALIDSVTNITLSHNLWMSNESRNPKAKGTVQYINNVVYNWSKTGLCGGHSATDHSIDMIGNYFIKGPSSNDAFAGQFTSTDHVYQAGNYLDMNRNDSLDGVLIVEADFHADRDDDVKRTYALPTFVSEAALHPVIPVTVQSAADACDPVIAQVGCSLVRDAVDRRLIDELKSFGHQGATIDHKDPRGEAIVGGLKEVKGGDAPADKDHDGMPDAWELEHKLDPKDAADAARLDASGYTQLELYLNCLAQSGSTAKK